MDGELLFLISDSLFLIEKNLLTPRSQSPDADQGVDADRVDFWAVRK